MCACVCEDQKINCVKDGRRAISYVSVVVGAPCLLLEEGGNGPFVSLEEEDEEEFELNGTVINN